MAHRCIARPAPRPAAGVDSPTVGQAAEEWIEGARTGAVVDRSGRRYKASTVRGYEQSLRDRIIPALGAYRLSELRRTEVQALADALAAEGLAPATIRNQLDPLRAIFRRALNRELVAINPTTGLELPHRAMAAIGSPTPPRRRR